MKHLPKKDRDIAAEACDKYAKVLWKKADLETGITADNIEKEAAKYVNTAKVLRGF